MRDDERKKVPMVVSSEEEKKEDTTEKIEEILKQENVTTYDTFLQDEIFQEQEENEKEDLENFNAITEKQYNLFENFSSQIENETKENKENEVMTFDEIIESTEIIDENIDKIQELETSNKINDEVTEPIEEIYEPKTVTIDFTKDMGKFETALEIKYNSLKLSQFPIKVSNVPEGMTFPDEVTIGNTSIKIGDEVIKNCYLKILSNESIKLLEIKNREFKLSLSVSLNDDTIKSYGSVRMYEISSLIKYSRMLKVLELLEKVFNGAIISFNVNKLWGDIEIEDRIELMKIKTIQNFFGTLEKSGYKFQVDKLPQCENIYYLLELYTALKENRIIETWCNFNLKNENFDLREKDFLIIKRKHSFDKNLVIEEKITLKAPLNKESIFKDKIVGYRKPCIIELSKA